MAADADANDVFDEVPDDAWDRLTGVPVTADILRQIHKRAKPKTMAKPLRAVDSLSDIQSAEFERQSPAQRSTASSRSKAAKSTRSFDQRNTKQQHTSRGTNVSMKIVTGPVNIADRYSRVRVETDDGEDATYYDNE
jgi:hypothetical protein